MSGNVIIFFRMIGVLVTSFLFSVSLTKLLIHYQRKRSIAQIERNYLRSNQLKKGTPTFGGVAIVLATILSFMIFYFDTFTQPYVQGILFTFLGFFFIGLIDDLYKVFFKNVKGLSASLRILLEVAIALVAILIMGYSFPTSWNIDIIFLGTPLYLGALFILFFIFLILATSNSVNLCDGLDGLAGGVVLMCSLPLIVFLIEKQEIVIASILMAQAGAIIGFLLFNFHPAKIFMGDCGALGIGALLGIAALSSNTSVVLALSSIILIFETFSVILQVFSFKLFKKRIFLMTPFHHSLQKKGWSETRIVLLFYLVGFIISFITTIMGVLV